MARRPMRHFIAFGTLAAVSLWASCVLAQTGTGLFTEVQAQAGQAIYNARCASCHDAAGEAGQLSGGSFSSAWRARTTQDLYTRIKTTMPQGNPGSLSDKDAAAVVAYLLK